MRKLHWGTVIVGLTVLGFGQPSWAWRGGGWHGGGWHGGGWHGGWGGPRVGLYIGGGPYYDPYYYDPYYYPYAPYAYPAPYAAYPLSDEEAVVPDNSAVEPTNTANGQPSAAQISRERSQLDYEYADGDISKAQYEAGIAQLKQNAQQAQNYTAPAQNNARTQAPAQNAYLSGNSTTGLNEISDLHLELTTLLDQKLKSGDITKSQHDAELNYLNQINDQANQEAKANGGNLTNEEAEALTRQLHRAYYAINHNLITH